MKISRQASRGQGRAPRGHTQDEDKQAGKQGAGQGGRGGGGMNMCVGW